MISVLISQYISLTKIKIRIASYLYKLINSFSQTDNFIVKRNGISLNLDIREGIDLSIYLFGAFQKHIFNTSRFILKSDPNIMDIGANIGLMSLTFAKLYPHGQVYSFEPTDYAFEKLNLNTSLNPDLKKRIHLYKAMVSETPSDKSNNEFYSSWKIDKPTRETHSVHSGSMKTASNIEVISIDSFLEKSLINHIDLIKIDTDGSELAILKGAVKTLDRFHPLIIFEVGLYLIKERNISFNDYLNFFHNMGYKVFHITNQKEITFKNYKLYIPKLGTTDLIASRDKH